MNTSSRLGLWTDTPSISPGKASTTSVTKRCPFSISSRTLLSSTVGLQSKALFDVLRQRVGFACFQQDHVAANFALQFRRSAQRDNVAFGVDRQAIAALGLFHQVRGNQHGDVFFVAQNLQVLPQIAARAGIEAGRRLIQQQHRRVMQQTLGQLQPPLHAAGKCLGFFFGAIGKPDAAPASPRRAPSAPRRASRTRGR